MLLPLYIKKTSKIFLRVILALLIISLAYFFYHPGITVFGIHVANPFYAYVQGFEFRLYLVVCFIAGSLLLFFLFFFFSLYYDKKRDREGKLTSMYEKYFADQLAEYLLAGRYNDQKERSGFVKSVKPYTGRWIQIDVLFRTYTHIQEALVINFSSKFINLLKELELYNKQKILLYSSNNVERIIAMRMLSYLRIGDYRDRIWYYTNSKNYALRTEAFAALVRLMDTNEQGLSFIEEKHRLSLLEINVIVNAVLKNFKSEIDYQGLLTSGHVCKKIVGALLIKNRNLKEYAHLLFDGHHIGTRNLLLRQTVWDSFLSLADENDAVKAILQKFEYEPDDVKLLILEKLQDIRDEALKDFMVRMVREQSLLIKIEALKILFNNDMRRFMRFKHNNNPEVKKAFDEVSDININ